MRNGSARQRRRDRKWLEKRADKLGDRIAGRLRQNELLNELGAQFPAAGNRAFVRETKGVRAFWISHGGYIEQSSPQADVFELSRDIVGFHVFEFEDKLKGEGVWETLEHLATSTLEFEIEQRVERVLQSAQVEPEDFVREEFAAAVWLEDRRVRAWVEEDNAYFHVQMGLPVGMMWHGRPSGVLTYQTAA